MKTIVFTKKQSYKVGSNQYVKRRKNSAGKRVRAYVALFTFMIILAYVLTLPIYAKASEVVSPIPTLDLVTKDAGESAKIEELEAKVDRFDKFMQMQVEINDLEKKWRQTQEVINLGI